MLQRGIERARAGIDVVIGATEADGPALDDALTRDISILGQQGTEYEGHGLGELDIDAVLARRPGLVLVDPLAFANAPGSRHPKRYQDVEELLDAGIDVFATLGIQQLDSLTDVAASLTHLRVDETVPDRLLERAELEVVDLPADELIVRLREARSRTPGGPTDAPNMPLSRSTLNALRTLTLRRAAQAVDAQVLAQTPDRAGIDRWVSGERIVVAVNELAGSDGLVRAAKRMADALHAPWTALHVETPREAWFAEKERQRVAATLNLASQLGAAVASVPARSAIDGLKTYAAENHATQLIVGKSMRSRWFEIRHGSVVDRLIREMPGVAVNVLPVARETTTQSIQRRHQAGEMPHYGWATAMVAGVTVTGATLLHILNLGNVALLYLVPVMAAASLFGRWPALFAGALSSLAYNFFFLPPTGTLTVNNPENVISLIVFLGVALLTSQLSGRVRAQADLAAKSARENAAMAGFLRQLGEAGTEDEMMQAVCTEIARLLDVRTTLLTAGAAGPELRAACPAEDRLDTVERAAAQWSLDRGVPAGRGSDTLTASDWLFHPLKTEERTIAVLGLARADARDTIRSDQLPLLMSLLGQATLALERMRLGHEMRGVAELHERDRLRAALLSSVSHDLRTPLTSILAAVREMKRAPSPSLIDTIDAESQRLSRFVTNLLGMARVEAGALKLSMEPVDLTDAIAGALHDTAATLEAHEVRLEIPSDLPLVRIDAQLLHHCLINLLDNAGRHGDRGAPITIRAVTTPARSLQLAVLDEGPGLPPGLEGEVFETFRRLEGSDRLATGTGLGLAIVKGFAEAMGLAVEARNRSDRPGACFLLTIPPAQVIDEGPIPE